MFKKIGVFIILLIISNTSLAQGFKFVPDRFSSKVLSSAISSSSTSYTLPAAKNEDDWTVLEGHPASDFIGKFKFKNVEDIIRVGINHDIKDIVTAYKYRLTIQIDCYDYSTPSTPVYSPTITLDISYDPDARKTYQDLAVHRFTGYHKIVAKLTSVDDISSGTPTSVAFSALKPNFFIESEVAVQRYDLLPVSMLTRCDEATDKKSLRVGWGLFYGTTLSSCTLPCYTACKDDYKPVSYELEWCYIDDYQYNLATNTSSYLFNTTSNINYDFRKNSTRVQITNDREFTIPLVYEHGAIIYRVRTVRPNPNNYKDLIYGPWSITDDFGTIDASSSCFPAKGYLITNPHTADKLNWQYTINFAEDAKYKHVINYFDGALKDRQTQTKINTDNNYIIAVDKVYDFEGRPSIVTLPTPIYNQKDLSYRSDLSLHKTTNNPYRAQDFDMIGCSRPDSIPLLSDNALAHQYYSPLNPDKFGMQQFVPDAQGYPFVQTVYSPDNTNKVLWQGGAGYQQQLWNGHNTQYQYARPQQYEIDQLLGTEAGNAQHYPKQIVTDPNGQSSYSIMDPNGKVAISGLQGDAPDDKNIPIEKLDNFVAGKTVCTDILADYKQDRLSNGLSATLPLYNDHTGDISFQYSAITYPFFSACTGQYLWAKAYYELKVTNDCATPLLNTNGIVGEQKVTTANGHAYTITDPAITLAGMPSGNYLANKKITFSTYDIHHLIDSFVFANEPTCYHDVNYFIKTAVDSTIFPCEGFVDTTDDLCTKRKKQMMKELYPGAKYGTYTKDADGRFIAGLANSILESMGLTFATSTTGPYLVRSGYSGTGFSTMISIPLPSGFSASGPLNPDSKWECSLDGGVTYSKTAYVHGDYSSLPGFTSNLINPSTLHHPSYDNQTDKTAPGYHKSLYYRTTFITPSLPEGTKYYAFIQAHNHDIISYKINGVENAPFSDPIHHGGENNDLMGLNPPGKNNIVIIVIQTSDKTTETYVPASDIDTDPDHVFGRAEMNTHIVANIPLFRYQDPCITLPASVTKDGVVYTNLKDLPVDKFIEIFNDQIAEALLPLHPEYCKLLNCNDGDFDQEFEQTISVQQAIDNNRFALDSIVAHDPLILLAGGSTTADRLKYIKNMSASTRIDVLALQQAYCAAGNAEEQAYCVAHNYKYQIDNFIFLNDDIKQNYFDILKSLYIGNRNLIKQGKLDSTANTCTRCSTKRMNLVKPAVFTNLDDLLTTGTDADWKDFPDWMKDLFKKAKDGDASPMSSAPSELKDSVDANKHLLMEAQANNLVEHLKNCSLSSSVRNNIYNSAMNVLTSGRALSPDIVKSIIIDTVSLSLNDLCHPFLVSYKFSPDLRPLTTEYTCAPDALYSDLLSFLQRSEVLSKLATATSTSTTASASFSLSSTNTFETQFGTSATVSAITEGLSGTSCTACYTTLTITGSTKTASIHFIPKKYNTGTNISTLLAGTSPSYTLSGVQCLNNDPEALATGYMAQNTALLKTACGTCSTAQDYYLWSSSLSFMDAPPASTSLSNVVTCVDIKKALTDFKTEQTTYAYSEATNHPLAQYTIANYLNYKLNKNYAYGDYERLMDGCAITDQLSIPKITTHYRIQLSSDAQANTFITALNSYGTQQPNYLRYKTSSSSNPIIFINFQSLSEDTLLAYKQYLDAYTGGVISRNYNYNPTDNNTHHIFSSATCAFNPASYTASYNTQDAAVWEENDYNTNYKLHTFRLSGSPTPKQEADLIADVENYLHASSPLTSCNTSYTYYGRDMLRSADYSTTLKQQYLGYIYALSSTTHSDVVTAVEPSTLGSHLSSFATATFTYDDPYCPGSRTNLYAYTPNPSPLPSGYDLAKNTILASIGTTPFPNTDFQYRPALGSRLAIIRKANGVYWYRYFDADNKMYNLYLTPPDLTKSIPLGSYTFSTADIHMGPHPNTFFMDVTASGKTVRCTGYADFPLGNSQVAQDVILDLDRSQVACTDTLDCEYEQLQTAILNGKAAYYRYFDSVVNQMSADMMTHLINTTKDTLIYCGQQQKYQHTLYYYDLVGNLTRTVPPAGVVALSDATIPTVATKRNGADPENKMTNHKKISTYSYNSLNQLRYQHTPDGGTSYFFYDAVGRQIFSQNSKQRPGGYYTYSLYDEQGRPMESGEVQLGCTYPPSSTADFDTSYCTFYLRDGVTTIAAAHPDFVTYSYDENTYTYNDLITIIHNKARRQVVKTFYDQATQDLGAISGEMLSTQENLRSRVAAIKYYATLAPEPAIPPATPIDATFATYYSYDIGGNVQTITYDYPQLKTFEQRYKRIDYEYDLVSGKVNMIAHNHGRPDQFYQQYNYDADNRITEVRTSNDGLLWNTDAQYSYYKHGPLATLKLGNQQVQSIQYAYTIQGWLKAINGDVLNPAKDMAQNGTATEPIYARDVIAHALRYFTNDYSPIGSTPVIALPLSGGVGGAGGGSAPVRNLYNGNIAQQTTGIAGHGTLMRTYQYDQLQRLKIAANTEADDDAAILKTTTPTNLYKSTYAYDMDGNITQLQRWDGQSTPVQIDNFSYKYETTTGPTAGIATNNNKLIQVNDLAAATTAPSAGLGGADLQPGQVAENYTYDKIGNLIRDKQAAEHILWDRFGKVSSIRDTQSHRYIYFDYDGKGNRIWKEVVRPIPGATGDEHEGEYYVRDAGGNILSVYRTHSKYNRSLLFTGLTSSATTTSPVLTGVLSSLTPTSYPGAIIGLMRTAHSTWADTYTDKPISFYLSADPTLKPALIYSGTAWINALRAYDATAYRKAFLSADIEVQPLYYSALDHATEGTKLLQHFAAQMPEERSSQVWSLAHTDYDPRNPPAVNAATLYTALSTTNAADKPHVVTEMLSAVKENETEATAFYDAVIADNDLWNSSTLRDNNGPWTTGIRAITNKFADDGLFAHFFDDWSDGSIALTACTTPEYKLNTLYEYDPATALKDMSTEASNAEIVGILTAMPDITGIEFGKKLIDAGVEVSKVNAALAAATSGDTISLAEHHIYGSSRLGVQRYDSTTTANVLRPITGSPYLNLNKRNPWYAYTYADLIDSAAREPYGTSGNTYLAEWNTSRTLARRYYEMTDHLGNVLATVLDRKTGAGTASGGTMYDHWSADLASTADYYPGGMMMPGRNTEYSWSRMGMQGQQKDDEVYGKGNTYAFKYRMEDARINRFFSVDPLHYKYAYNSDYAFGENRLIDGVELEGLEYSPSNAKLMRDNTAVLLMPNPNNIPNPTNDKPIFKQRDEKATFAWSTTIYESEAGFERAKATTDQTAAAIPGVPLLIKKARGEEITKSDVAWELVGVIPVSRILSIPAKSLRVSSYAFKHIAAKIPWNDVVRGTKSGASKFIHGCNVEKLTKEAWDAGQVVNNGKPWKVYQASETIGASAGKETNFMRVELTESTGELHASPITKEQFQKLTSTTQ